MVGCGIAVEWFDEGWCALQLCTSYWMKSTFLCQELWYIGLKGFELVKILVPMAGLSLCFIDSRYARLIYQLICSIALARDIWNDNRNGVFESSGSCHTTT